MAVATTSVITEARPTRQATSSAFVALLLRDLTVLRKELGMFLGRTIMQPLLLIFVFTYVFPKIGQGVGGAAGSAAFSSILVPDARVEVASGSPSTITNAFGSYRLYGVPPAADTFRISPSGVAHIP